MNAQTRDLTTGKPLPLLVSFSLPLMIGNVFQQMYTVVDTAVVGKALGVGALADTIGFSPLFAVLAIFDLMGAVVIWTVLKSKSADELAKESLGKPATQS